MIRNILLTCLTLQLAQPVAADIPDIVGIDVTRHGMSWRFSVTLDHEDQGWDHFADAWQILDADGNLLAERELMHPHVNERPFTRSLNAVTLPDGTRTVYIRARCSVEGWGDVRKKVVLPIYK